MSDPPERERDRHELIDRDGAVLGVMLGVWSDEPCWRQLDMFFLPFRFEALPAFEAYQPIFDGLLHAIRARDRSREIDLRRRIFESVRIRASDGAVWIPPVIYIDGECGWYRVTRVPVGP